MTDVNPYAAPAARVEDVAQEEGIQLAGRGARLRAFVIDSFLFVIAFMLPMVLAWAVVGKESTLPGGLGFAFFFGLLGVNIFLLYKSGQTVGKHTVGIRIVRPDGSRAGLGRVFFLRSFLPGLVQYIPVAGPLFFLVDSLFIFREPRRCVHDYIADTIVIKA